MSQVQVATLEVSCFLTALAHAWNTKNLKSFTDLYADNATILRNGNVVEGIKDITIKTHIGFTTEKGMWTMRAEPSPRIVGQCTTNTGAKKIIVIARIVAVLDDEEEEHEVRFVLIKNEQGIRILKEIS